MATTILQVLKNHKLPASPAAVSILPTLGMDFTKHGTPGRALIHARYEDTLFLGGINGQAGLTGAAADCIWEPVFERCVFTVEHTADGKGESKWGAIPYGMVRPTFIDCVFRDVTKEHGLYAHMLVGAKFIRCKFINIGAQGIQAAERSAHHGGYETWDIERQSLPQRMPGEIELIDCEVVNCGKPSGVGRASFALTFFGPQSDDPAYPVPAMSAVGVTITNTIIRHRDSIGGAMTFQKRPKAHIIGGDIDYRTTGTNGAKPIIFFNRSKNMLLKDQRVRIGKIDLLDCPAGQLTISNCLGQAVVRKGTTGPTGSVKYITIGTLDALQNAVI